MIAFVFSASEAWWVEGGKLQYPVKGATIIGNGPVPEIVFLLKSWFVFFLMILVRAALGRVRPDQIVNIGWKVFMPLSVINLAVVLLLKTGGFF